MFRCPVCIGALAEPAARHCPFCRQSLRRRRPRVLGKDTRPGTRMLPIERAIAARAQTLLGPTLPGAPTRDGTRAARDGEPPDPAIDTERAPLDQEVWALVDELYERARAETRP